MGEKRGGGIEKQERQKGEMTKERKRLREKERVIGKSWRKREA